MGNVSHLVTRTAALQSSVENGLAEGMPAKDRQFVTALARGLDILRAFHAGEGMLGNQEIAHRTGLPKPTVARLTHTLTELGYLNYIRRFRKYELGASVLALGYAAISSMDVRRASRQPLETARPRAQRLDRAGRPRPSFDDLPRGLPRPVGGGDHPRRRHARADGQHGDGPRLPVLAARRRPQQADRCDPPPLARRLDQGEDRPRALVQGAADRGFCVTWGEWLPELCGVGAPLRNTDGTAAYAINASAPIYQISRDRLEADWGPRLVKVARDIRTGMAAQPCGRAAAPAAVAARPMTNGNGHRPPMSAMARR